MGAVYAISTACSSHSCANLISIGNGCDNYKSFQIINSSRGVNRRADLASGQPALSWMNKHHH